MFRFRERSSVVVVCSAAFLAITSYNEDLVLAHMTGSEFAAHLSLTDQEYAETSDYLIVDDTIGDKGIS